jgi:HD-GYP domain-containing protein (c-di-GMP phosphodiesterase class II)
LKGKDIPLGAKIIAVADFYEAVTSQRHYRDPMQMEEAFRLLREGSGSHFERHIVEAFINCRKREATEEGEVRTIQPFPA